MQSTHNPRQQYTNPFADGYVDPSDSEMKSINLDNDDNEPDGQGRALLPPSSSIVPVDLLTGGDARPEQLQYLSIFSEDELKALTKKYGHDAVTLDQLVQSYRWCFRSERFLNWYANATNVAYAPFQIVTSRDGVQNMVSFYDETLKVPDTVGLAVGIPISLIYTAFTLILVSPAKEAVKSTLDYAFRDSLKTRLINFTQLACAEPAKAAAIAATATFNQIVIKTHNGLASIANVLPYYETIRFSLPLIGETVIPAWMDTLSAKNQCLIIAASAFGVNRFYSQYNDPDYFENLKNFLGNTQGEPYLIGEIYRGNYAIPFQIALQGLISTVALRAYPQFYSIALAFCEKILKTDSSKAEVVAAIATVIVAGHTLCVRYPKTYRRYMSDYLKVEALLKEKYAASVEEEIKQALKTHIDSLNIPLNPITLEKRKQELIDKTSRSVISATRQLFEDELLEAHGWK